MNVFREWLGEFKRGKHGEDNEQSQNFEGKLKKVLKTDLFAQNTRFSWLSQVAFKSPRQVARTLKTKIFGDSFGYHFIQWLYSWWQFCLFFISSLSYSYLLVSNSPSNSLADKMFSMGKRNQYLTLYLASCLFLSLSYRLQYCYIPASWLMSSVYKVEILIFNLKYISTKA